MLRVVNNCNKNIKRIECLNFRVTTAGSMFHVSMEYIYSKESLMVIAAVNLSKTQEIKLVCILKSKQLQATSEGHLS